jgi:phosphate transport system substrate-binding protein
MKSLISILIFYFLALFASSVFAQTSDKKVVVTGVRFAYPLVEKWIEAYKVANSDAEITIESRTTTDPAKYDLLIEAFEPDNSVKESREYLYLGRYALLPVANAKSTFAQVYGEKGLTADLIKQIYFNDIYADKKNQKKLLADFTIYTRLQKAGAPITFSKYFGYEQASIQGKAIAGADEHLVKALLKDTTGISYNVPGLLYDLRTRKPLNGLTIIPVDTDGNGRVSDDEHFFDNLDTVVDKIEEGGTKNIPIEFLHLSIAKNSTNPEALKFLQWVAANGQEDLLKYGFLKLDPKRYQQEKAKFNVAIN